MSTFTYIVTVETEREKGKFAGRDEISDKITDAINDAENSIDVTGIGPDSDSDYTVTLFGVEELEKKDLKTVNAEYDQVVAAERDPDSIVRDKLKTANARVRELEAQVSRLKGDLEKKAEEASETATRIWFGDRDNPSYLPDGRYDHVVFEVKDYFIHDGVLKTKGRRAGIRVGVRVDHHGEEFVEVYSDSSLLTNYVSGNVIHLKSKDF